MTLMLCTRIEKSKHECAIASNGVTMEKQIEEDLQHNFEEFFVQAFHYTHPGTELDFDSYLQYVCHRYQTLRSRERIIFNQPPRSLKSWTAKYYAAWYLGRFPNKHIMIMANTQRLADDIVYEIRSILRARWYKNIFLHTRIAKDRSSVSHFKTTLRGGVLAASVEGSVAGFGADLLILDDPNKIEDASRPNRLNLVNQKFDGEIYSRLNNKKKSIVIVVQHRLNENDLSGHLIAKGYKVIALPLVAPRDKNYKLDGDEIWHRKKGAVLLKSYSRNEIEAARKQINPDYFWFFQQGIGRNEAEKIEIEDFKLINTNRDNGPFVISIDAAQREGPAHSYNVIQLWQQVSGTYHLYHQFRQQCSFATMQSAATGLIKRFRPTAILIETAANGGALFSVLRETLSGFNFIPVAPRGSKEERLSRHRDKFKAGLITLQATEPWIVDYLLEFSDFPARGTDQVDGTTQMLDYADANPIWGAPPSREFLGRIATGRPVVPLAPNSWPQGMAIVRSPSIFRKF
jgi:phage terminase large subunit-like protein